MAETEPELLWTPTPERVEAATLTRFARWVQATRGVDVVDAYEDLHRWSVDDLDGFWSAVWEFFDVTASTPPERTLGDRSMPGTEWFPGATLSYAEHLFRGKPDSALALQHASELRELDFMTWGELRDLTARIATGLKFLGVTPGDRVVGYIPNIPEAIAAFLACASLGATWSSSSPDFGTRSVVDRFAQIEPKVLIAVDGYRYGGKDFDRRDVVAQLRQEIPSLEHTVLLDYLGADGDPPAGTMPWRELIRQQEPLEFAQLPFDHPLWVVYSSGTTGLPKPIVHGQGGVLLEHLKVMNLHLDAQAGDRVFWFTTTGWMMWNFLVGVLLTEASIVLYDGNPGTPTLDRLWDLAAEAEITTFGTSAAFIASCMKAGIDPKSKDLNKLEAVGSTGSPLAPEGFQWVYDHVGADTWLFSTSGGTDVVSAFVGGVPTLPVYRGELQARALGADVQAWDPDGRPLTGAVGELVLAQPLPSMPVFFWGDDEEQTRLRESYFDVYPGVWRHGDWIEITERGTAIIYGRSDSTINRGGIRMGTSEIYRAVLADDAVVDALVVDIPDRPGHPDGWMPLFVVLRDGEELTDDLVARIKARIRTDCSPRHVPNEVQRIAEVPRTLSGKALEVPVKRILMGRPPEEAASRDSLANPAALDVFVAMAPGSEGG
ncbi:MAG TPA: acetoacetate--CoA ligase [Baekduia sp.]|uniref:acetoacetate--CoA ligase n=1 Tax=Baekduia sp. TaxID=2600305 RepID=UPI002D776D5F|nr:acetoacetate--CoA ligase [Baekduia sp.]HET6505826.1 acetoacetate--CoA ligase [Baekduia sp.]